MREGIGMNFKFAIQITIPFTFMNYSTLLKLKAQTPDVILKTLSLALDREKDADNPRLPLLQVGISSDVKINGYLISYDPQEHTLLLALIVDGQAELKYISTRTIQFVEVLHSKYWLHELSSGDIPFEPAEEEVPSVLALKTILKAETLKLHKLIGKSISLALNLPEQATPLVRYYTRHFIIITMEAIQAICKDDLGMQAFGEGIASIKIHPEYENKVELSDGELQLHFRADKGLKQAFDTAELQKNIEKQL